MSHYSLDIIQEKLFFVSKELERCSTLFSSMSPLKVSEEERLTIEFHKSALEESILHIKSLVDEARESTRELNLTSQNIK